MNLISKILPSTRNNRIISLVLNIQYMLTPYVETLLNLGY